ncbi:MAG: Smr/MutS family protein [Burkholderiaceae bacterium]|nr:Smr/MutS family protein [Burkholderiaceae bacterium]
MKRPAARGPLRSLAELKSIRVIRPRAPASESPQATSEAPAQSQSRRQAHAEFRAAVQDVSPLQNAASALHNSRAPSQTNPQALQRERDNRAVLAESLNDCIGVDSLLETDEALSYRRPGVSADSLRKLRRSFWVVQAELDLHGHRVAEAHEALGEFLRESIQHGLRCVRIVHGKGRGSRDGVPVLKGKVRVWLARRSEVIAFCQARPADGGAGALLVLLKPSG